MAFSDSLNLGIGDAVQGLTTTAKNALGISTGTTGSSNTPNPLPWTNFAINGNQGPIKGGSGVSSAFYPYINIDPSRWNQLFPYRLLVVDVTNQNRLVGNYSTNSTVKLVQGQQQGSFLLNFEPLGYNWVFDLPITPQQLNITDQYAITTTATLRGILEEHNGIKFKIINASGTMGVWPYRQSVAKPPGTPGILQSVFGGTLTALNSFVSQVGTVINTFTTNSPSNKPTTISPTDPGANPGSTSTGYYQAMYLQQFLEQYAESKKNPANAGWRLVFDIPKQNQSYVVTPMQFTWRQSAEKPMEIMYQLQFKAWRRINLQEVPQKPSPAQSFTITPGILQRITNGITEARLACSSAIGVIGAVTSDVNGVFNVLSQTALFVKDLQGVGASASDMPSSIVKDFNSAIQLYVANNSSAVAAGVTTAGGAAAVAAIAANNTQNNGLSSSNVRNGQLGMQASNSVQTSNVSTIFNNPNANIDLLDQVPMNQLTLNSAQQNRLNSILSNTSLTVAQLNQNANSIQNLTTLLANYFGAGGAAYNELFGYIPPPVTTQAMSIYQYLLLDTLYEVIQGISYLTASTQVTDQEVLNSLEYVASLANASDITFDVPNSKMYVPVPFGLNIEQIAARYLGDATRWIEIATLNNLEEPYISEDGFQLPLLSNAIGRQVIVSNNQNLYIGQTVYLRSSTQMQVVRKIDNITALPNNTAYILTLNGLPNLSNFTIADQAYVQAYLPNTVNSQQKIFIPSDQDPPTYPGQANVIPPPVAANDPLTGISGVDLLLTEAGDLALDNYGNFLISYGLTNLIQALRILFSTILNSWICHPEYGLGIAPGTSVSDLNLQQIYQQINSQITQDPRFSSISNLQIMLNPPVLSINLVVALPNQSGVLPLTFQLAA